MLNLLSKRWKCWFDLIGMSRTRAEEVVGLDSPRFEMSLYHIPKYPSHGSIPVFHLPMQMILHTMWGL